jgi:hypothetical protein
MKKASALLLLAAVALLVIVPAGVFAGTIDPEGAPAVFAGHAYYDLTTGTMSWETNPAPLAAVNIYSNTASAPAFAVSSTDLAATWGDEVTTTGTGTLDQVDFTIFNSGSSAGLLLTATFTVNLFDGPSSTFLGGFTTPAFTFPGGLPTGFFTILTVTGVSGLGINLPGTNVIITQKVASKTGTANRLGVAGLSPVTVGVGGPAMYIAASTFGPAGFYTLAGVPSADPGYRLAVLEPTPAKSKTWGSVKGMYRK